MLFGLLVVVLFVSTVISSPSCLDESGNPVDSWTVFKQPVSYNYYVLNGASFVKSKYTLDQTSDGAVMRTASQLYNLPASGSYALSVYSDEPPGKKVSTAYAHAKGMLLTDVKQGFWLVHSMPLWPAKDLSKDPGGFPSGIYGQSLTCITISADTANIIAGNLMVARPYVYSSRFDASLASALPSLKAFAASAYTKTTAPVAQQIFTLGGVALTQFAKSASWAKDLWDDLVSPFYSSPLAVETWRNGAGGRMSSICGTHGEKHFSEEVYQIAEVQMSPDVSWKGTSDHSKWCVSTTATGSGDARLKVTCVGDINRMCSQEGRGGGALCLVDQTRWSAFTAAISSLEGCYSVDPCLSASTDSCYWCHVPTLAPNSPPTAKSPAPTWPEINPGSSPTLPTSLPPSLKGTKPTTRPTPKPTAPSTRMPTPKPSTQTAPSPPQPYSQPTPLPTISRQKSSTTNSGSNNVGEPTVSDAVVGPVIGTLGALAAILLVFAYRVPLSQFCGLLVSKLNLKPRHQGPPRGGRGGESLSSQPRPAAPPDDIPEPFSGLYYGYGGNTGGDQNDGFHDEAVDGGMELGRRTGNPLVRAAAAPRRTFAPGEGERRL